MYQLTETYLSHDGIGDGVQVKVALVREIVEDVGRPHCLWPTLFVAEDQVNPLMQLTRHKLRLQRLVKRKTDMTL